MIRFTVKARILLPLIVSLLLILGFMAWHAHAHAVRAEQQLVTQKLGALEALLQQRLAEAAHDRSVSWLQVARDPGIQRALREGASEPLRSRATALIDALGPSVSGVGMRWLKADGSLITALGHLAWSGVPGRIDEPARGLVISASDELVLVLRIPIIAEGHSLGAVEWREAFEPDIDMLESRLNARVFILADALARTSGPAAVQVVAGRTDRLREALSDDVERGSGGSVDLVAESRIYAGRAASLQNHLGAGQIQAFLLEDVTAERASARKDLLATLSLGGVLSLLIVALVGFMADSVDRQLVLARRHLQRGRELLEEEVAQRTTELSAGNQRLLKEVHEREAAEERLVRNQVFLLTIIDSLAYPFCVLDPRDYSIKLANKSALDSFSLGSSSCHALLYGHSEPCKGPSSPCVLKEIYRRKRPVRVEHRRTNAEGRESVFEVHAYPVFDDQGEVAQVIEYFIDVTERRLAEEALKASEHQYRELVETANSVILRWDGDARVRFVNGYGLRFFGFRERDLLGKSLIGTLMPSTAADGRDQMALLQDIMRDPDRYRNYENENLCSDGSRVWVSWTNKAIRDDSGRVVEILSIGNDISERIRTLRALQQSEARFRHIYDNVPVMMHSVMEDGSIIDVNKVWLAEMGFTADEVRGRRLDFLMTRECRSRYLFEIMPRFWRSGFMRDVELQFIRKDGQVIDLILNGDVTIDPAGRRVSLNVLQNVTEHRRAQQEMQLAASVFESSCEGILITDAQGSILRVNSAFTAVTGYAPEEVINMNPRILASGRHDRLFYEEMWHSLTESGFWQGEIWNRRKNGEIYPEWLSISTLRNAEGVITHYVGLFTDITDQKLSEKRIYHLAHYDALTELPNRVLFQDRLEHALREAKRSGNYVPLLYLDLDRFKPINDSFGHPVGDLLLQQVAKRLQGCVREADTVARMGGDEFTVILTGITTPQDLVQIPTRVARSILAGLARPFHLEGHEVFISASIGVVVYPNDGLTVAELVRNADTAMYHAKAKGRSLFVFYEPHMNAAAADRLLIENNLRRALDRSEFELHYQPSMNLTSGRVESLEALVRWRHPEMGMVPPDEFIPLAEETGLIVPIGEWVMSEAARQVAVWQREGLTGIRVAINLSPRQFRQRDLIPRFRQIIGDAGLQPTALAIELTESAFMEDTAETVAKLNELNQMGLQILIDDFGTGYSSLGRLRALPIHTLKIDRNFVRDIATDPNDASIVSAVIAMAHSLQLRVIAEGVETREQLSFLRSQGCDEIQGFLLSKPLPAAEIQQRLRQGLALPVLLSNRA